MEIITKLCDYCFENEVIIPYDLSCIRERSHYKIIDYLSQKKVKCEKCKLADKIKGGIPC